MPNLHSYELNGFPVCYCNNGEISQINEEAVPENVHEEGNKIQFGIFMGEALFDLFNLEFVSEKVSFFQMQSKSCITSCS